ncbi:MAG: lipopolysaccharide biosynthesis protein, partial [Bacteroidetes bacterium]|nr:lipopolysaccharide biosynthesis protein [Bacteroidota bacterium]
MVLQPHTIQSEDEISLRDLVLQMQQIFQYLLSRWVILLAAGIMGGGLGYFYATLQPTLHVSRLSFVVEDGKSGGGGIAALAGQFGFDMGGGSGGSLFSGDNIL